MQVAVEGVSGMEGIGGRGGSEQLLNLELEKVVDRLTRRLNLSEAPAPNNLSLASKVLLRF
jgi:hypothetical protein